jgi:hypothetical protein
MVRYFPGLVRSPAGLHLKTVFAEGESGIPNGYSPLAAGGEITWQIRRRRFPPLISTFIENDLLPKGLFSWLIIPWFMAGTPAIRRREIARKE